MQSAADTTLPLTVPQALGQSRTARQERQLALSDALALAQWHNHSGQVMYSRPGHHTLSVYLEGGWGTHLVGQPGLTGSPTSYCLLPAEHESHWQLGGPQRFVHLYLSDVALSERVVRLLDAEPRGVHLPPTVFGQDLALTRWAHELAGMDWSDSAERLRIDEQTQQMLDRLVLTAARPALRSRAERVRGGLSGPVRRRVLALIDARLDDPSLSLALLAHEAHLSEFHFARMFRMSVGCSVHHWVSARRLALARQLLRHSPMPLADVAAACGFASASHLSQRFKAQLRVTPGQYRQAWRACDTDA